MRVYLPATVTTVAELHKSASVGTPGVHAHAVTPALREWYVEGDEEELEYVAFNRAAQGALRLLSADDAAPRKRVVISADVPDSGVTVVSRDLGTSEVVIAAAITLKDVAAVHIDSTEAEADVARAAEAVEAAAAGDDDAQFTVDSAEDHDLLWYAPEEISDLLS